MDVALGRSDARVAGVGLETPGVAAPASEDGQPGVPEQMRAGPG